VPWFVGSIFASAFLLFLVQPMVGKQILPWFGGGTGVWTLCLTFYQSTLFLGYAYAHLLIRGAPPRLQPVVHGGLLVAALLALPVLPDASWQPDPGADPRSRILLTLVASVGLPFFLLAASGPLVQAWYARVFPNRSPYPLYAASNLGSLVALVGFPFAIEPTLGLAQASRLWSWAFAACGLALLLCAWRATRSTAATATPTSPTAAPGLPNVLLWIFLPAVAVVLLLGVTNELCLDIASIPFLWVLPLSLYLLTLIVCFSSDGAYRRGAVAALAAAATVAILGVWAASDEQGWWSSTGSMDAKIALYSVALFSWCMLAHGELYRLRPAPARLTTFYLCVAGGGALGGLFVGLAAPLLFSDYFELPIGLVACWLLFLACCWRDRSGPLQASPRRRTWRSLALVCAALLALGTGWAAFPTRRGVLLQERNFFGVLTVTEVKAENPDRIQRELSSGTTLHGAQLIHPTPRRPTAYYGTRTGIGFVMRALRAKADRRIGVVGLGIGTLAAYGRPGDRIRFYEIDPDVIRIARDTGRFTYLGDSRSDVRVVPGDGRLSIEAELARGNEAPLDLLVLDAFASDAVPVHLLTQEAFALYRRRVAVDGVIAFHLSTRHLDLVSLVLQWAQHAGLPAVAITNDDHGASYASRWVIVSKDADAVEAIAALACADSAQVWEPDKQRLIGVPLWTDDYSDLLRILRPESEFLDPRSDSGVCTPLRSGSAAPPHASPSNTLLWNG